MVLRITHARSSAPLSLSLIMPHTFCIDLQITLCEYLPVGFIVQTGRNCLNA